ncbi:branched-chain amino acid transporter permease [Xenorhabdus bovienii]|uniref:branched-chain amino acid transporter permease n=1 Tax=Xenorhabdus bovienii TaxID=40576 RepID=UPI002157B6D1|nr:AzlD domain-containing protein [Xenorhabdus bovienii]
MSEINILWTVLTVSVITVILRAIPFILVDLLSNNEYLKHIGNKMPVGVMFLLVVYTFIHIDFTAIPYGIPQIISTLLVILFYWYSRNALTSIGFGLAVHLLLANWVF